MKPKQRTHLRLPAWRARAAHAPGAGFLLLAILAALLGPGDGQQTASARALSGLAAPLILENGAAGGGAAWGDYDNDDDLDLLVAGTNSLGQPATILYRNDRLSGVLEEVPSGLPQVESASVDWGDYNNDGYLDVLLTGKRGIVGGQIAGLAGVYRSKPVDPTNPAAGRFFELACALSNIYEGAGKWGDFDNDGRLDILLSGYSDGGAPLTRIYRNTAAGFTPVTIQALADLGGGSAAWGDYDNDGYLDFAVMGRQADGAARTLVYHANHSGGFEEPIELTGMWGGALLFFDLDNDQDLELLVSGNRGDNYRNILPTTILYRYDGQAFSPVENSGLPDIWQSALSAGDYNHDGYTDLLLNGMTVSDRPTRIYVNTGSGAFTDSGVTLPTGAGLAVLWGDFNNDQALDLAISGVLQGFTVTTQFFVNENLAPPDYLPPAAPELVAACWNGGSRLTLEWSTPARDDLTRSPALSYNLRMGTSPGAQNIASPAANLSSGYHRLAQPGRLFPGESAILRNLPYQYYYWSVQSVDATLAGSPFSPEHKIYLGHYVAWPDIIFTVEDTPITFNVLANDYFDSLSVHKHSWPDNGLLAGSDGAFTFTPDPNWNGITSFDYYAVSAPSRYCSGAPVTIFVIAMNDAPSAILLSNNNVLSDLPAGTQVGLFSVVDPDQGDTHTYELVPGSYDNGFFQIDGNRLLTNQVFDYALNSAFTIQVIARDAAGQSVTQIFTISVEHNTPVSITCASNCGGFDPLAKILQITMSEDGAPLPFQLTLLGEDPNTDEPLTWSLFSPPASGTAQAEGTRLPGEEMEIQYMPDADWFSSPAPDSFVVRVDDSQGHQDTLTVQVQVEPVNDPPSLDPIPNPFYAPRSGAQQIALSGIGPGPANEAGQPLSFQVETDRPDLVTELWIDYPGSGQAATLHLNIAGAEGPAQVRVTLSDGQPENNTITRSFTITILSDPRIYLPLVFGP